MLTKTFEYGTYERLESLSFCPPADVQEIVMAHTLLCFVLLTSLCNY